MLNHPGLSRELSEHFLQLSSAIRCLCRPTSVATSGFIRLATQLLKRPEASYVKLYRQEQVMYRIHYSLADSSIADDVECYGV
jgi:hypothetical protein